MAAILADSVETSADNVSMMADAWCPYVGGQGDQL
jgi:hypothetical protein